MIPLAYNLRNLAVRSHTAVATALGFSFVVFVLCGALMLANGVQRTFGRTVDDSTAIVLRKGAGTELVSTIAEPQVAVVLSQPGIVPSGPGAALGAGEVVVSIVLKKEGTTGVSNVLVRGVPEGVSAWHPGVRMIAGRAARRGTDEVVVGRAISGRLQGTGLGQSFELRKHRPVRVVGIFEAGRSSYESEVWADRDAVQTAFHREGMVSSLRVRLASPALFDSFRLAVDKQRQLGVEVLRERDYFDRQSEGSALFVTALGMSLGLLFGLGALFGATITMHAWVASRAREIGTLRALGFGRASLAMSFLLEALILSMLGGTVGALASLVLGTFTLSFVNYQTLAEIVVGFEPTPGIIGFSLLVASAMGLVGGLAPAIRAGRMDPARTMRC